MIIKQTVTFKDTVMHVTRHDGMRTASEPSAAVEVSNIPSSMREDTLKMLFENTKRSGGGDIERIDFVPGSARAVITFQDSAGIYLMKFCVIQYLNTQCSCHCSDDCRDGCSNSCAD